MTTTLQPGDEVRYIRCERDGGQIMTMAVVVEIDPKSRRIGIALLEGHDLGAMHGRPITTDRVVANRLWRPMRVDPKSIYKP